MKQAFPFSHRLAALAFAGALFLAVGTAQAQLQWNPAQDLGVTQGGSGTWGTTGNWYDPSGGTNVVWPNTSTTAAVFDGTAGTVTFAANTNVGALTFNTGGWSILSNSTASRALILGGTVTVNGGIVQIGSSAAPVTIGIGSGRIISIASGAELIFANSVGSGSINLTGGGTLAFLGASTYTGGTTITNGTITIPDFSSLGSGGVTVSGGSTLQLTGTTTSGTRTMALGNAAGGIFDVTGTSVATIVNTITNGAANAILTKTGTGTLILSEGRSGTTGATNINAGTLELDGTHSAGASIVVNSSGTLSGTGTFGAATLNSGGTISPGTGKNTLHGASITWNPGGELNFILGSGTTSNLLSLSGALTKGSSGTGSGFLFNFSDAGDFLFSGQTYSLITFGSTTFSAGDFSYASSISGLTGAFSIVGNTLEFTASAVPEPSTWAMLAVGLGLIGFLRLRRQAA